MNHDYYHKQNSCYDSTSIGFDQSQPQQYTVNHPIFNAHHDLLGSQKKLNITLTKDSDSHMEEIDLPFTPDDPLPPSIEDDDYDSRRDIPILEELLDNYSLSLPANESYHFDIPSPYLPPAKPPDGNTRILNIKMMGDNSEQQLPLNYESKWGYIENYNSYPYDSSSFPQQHPCCEDCGGLPEADHCQPPTGDEHLNTIPAMESDEFIKSCVENLVPNPSESKGENGCDVPACFITFSNVLFDADYEFDSSDDHSLYDEDVPEKIFSNHLFEEEIIPMKIDQHHDNTESDLVESMRTHDSSLIISSKIDYLLDEFAGELTLLKSIPPGIDETDCDPEEDIRLIDDSLMKEIDLSFNPDYPMPSGIEDDDCDSERDILILKDLPSNDTLSLPVIESYHFDIHSFSRPPAKPPYGNTGILNIKMMGDISEQKVPMPILLITRVSNQEKSPDLLSH
nr:hypothetical protein [Tanacetum cinerariifolium]